MDKARRYGCRCWIIALWNHMAICTFLALSMYLPLALGSRNGNHFQSVGDVSVKRWAFSSPSILHRDLISWPAPLVPKFVSPASPASPDEVDRGNASPPKCSEELCSSTQPTPAPPPDSVGTQTPPVPSPSPIPLTAPSAINTQEKAGVAIASVAALLQVIVAIYLLIKRRQMLALVDCDEYDHLNSNYGRLVSA